MKHCAPRDPQRVPKPKYEATARQARLNIGYPNSTTGSMYNRTALLTGEATPQTRFCAIFWSHSHRLIRIQKSRGVGEAEVNWL